MRSACFVFCLLLTACSASSEPKAADAGCPSDLKLARLVAQSSVIAQGLADIPSDQLRAVSVKAQYLTVAIKEPLVLKGAFKDTAVFRYYSQDRAYSPSLEALQAAATTPSLFYLYSANHEGELYFAGYVPDALGSISAGEATEQEIARQKAILDSWHADPSVPHYGKVKRLISRLEALPATNHSLEGQQQIFDELIALGKPAVPAIVAQMDNRRPLAMGYIRVENTFPGAFEASAQYGPETLTDALSVVLAKIANVSFGQIANGGTEEQRSAVVAGWRVYAADLRCSASE